MISRGISTGQSPPETDATPAPAATAAAPIRVTAPNGQVLQFPNQAAADEFKKKAGIK
jgi:hypothetical protein